MREVCVAKVMTQKGRDFDRESSAVDGFSSASLHETQRMDDALRLRRTTHLHTVELASL